MTRSYGSTRGAGDRNGNRLALEIRRSVRDPSIGGIMFTCFRLVAIEEAGPGEPAWAPIELMHTSNAMGAFMHLK